jgi:hypothetical protein
VGDIKQIIVGSTTIDASELKTKIKGNDFTATENWLNDKFGIAMILEFRMLNYFGCLSLIKGPR